MEVEFPRPQEQSEDKPELDFFSKQTIVHN